MHLKHTFQGPFNRVQLEAIDVPGDNKPGFYVAGLPQEAHSACNFRIRPGGPATRLYAGDSFTEAWAKVVEITSRSHRIPKKFARYLR